MSLPEKLRHKGQGVVWVVRASARPTQRYGSPRSHCTVNLRAGVGSRTGKCSLSLSEVEDTSLFRGFQPAPIACKVRTGFFQRRQQKCPYAVIQHERSIKVTVTYIYFLFTAVVAQE